MRKYFMYFSALFLISCSGGEGGSSASNNVTSTIKTSADLLKDFEQKESIAWYSGMNFGGKRFNRVLYIAIANYEGLELGMFNLKEPKEKGQAYVYAAIYGPNGTDKKNLTPLTKTKYTTDDDEEGRKFTVFVVVNEGGSYPAAKAIDGSGYTSADKIKGEVEFTEIGEERAKGKLTYSIEGGHELTMDFDVAIAKDLWAEMTHDY